MTTYWTNGLVDLYHADARALPLPDESVHCVVTSPPYFGLRDYNVPDGIGLEGSMDEYLEQIVLAMREVSRVLREDGTLWLNLGDAYAAAGHGARDPRRWPKQSRNDHSPSNPPGRRALPAKNLLGIPWRAAFALQEDGWILRSDVVWSKANSMPESATDRPVSAHEYVFLFCKTNKPLVWIHEDGRVSFTEPDPDFVWISEETADRLPAPPDDPDGEWLGKLKARWHSPAHGEWRRWNRWSSRSYFYDAEAVRTPMAESSMRRLSQLTFDLQSGGPKDPLDGPRSSRRALENLHRKLPSSWAQSEHYRGQDPRYEKREDGETQALRDDWFQMPQDNLTRSEQVALGANLRNVWHIATQPYSGAHFATFPEQLPLTCILAGTSESGVCGECGAPRWRTVKLTPEYRQLLNSGRAWRDDSGKPNELTNRHPSNHPSQVPPKNRTTGWQPSCNCDADAVPATVLDPFSGSGTTCLVAQRLGRRGVGVDLSTFYLDMAAKRIGPANAPLLGN